MSTTDPVQLPFMTLAAISTTPVFIPSPGEAGAWRPTGGVTGARAAGELRGKTGNFQCVPAVQVANDIRSPGTATAIGTTFSTDSVVDPTTMTSITNSATSRVMRAGWLVSLSSGTTLAVGTAGGWVEFNY